jgi:hypothetical protein
MLVIVAGDGYYILMIAVCVMVKDVDDCCFCSGRRRFLVNRYVVSVVGDYCQSWLLMVAVVVGFRRRMLMVDVMGGCCCWL